MVKTSGKSEKMHREAVGVAQLYLTVGPATYDIVAGKMSLENILSRLCS